MNAQELRIGNLVMRYSNIMEVSGISNETADLILIQPNTRVNWRMLYEDIFSIPLTEEWLVRFGFERSGSYYVKDQVYIHDCYSLCNDTIEYTKHEYRFNYTKRYLVYVHQLQNLYHALTGQELTYNPK